MTLTAASCFSGIGAPELGGPEFDWKWCAEIEKFPAAVLAQRFPESINLGDVTADDFLQNASRFGKLDLLVGGPPCQAFSVAGLRKSLDDDRGNLSLRFLEIAHAIRPRNLLVENVPGWLSTDDNAFGCFLAGLVGADDPLRSPIDGKWPSVGMVAGPRSRAAWRVFDAQYFGVAQRRRRVFVVADFGSGADPAEILFERQGSHGNIAPRREAAEGVAGTISARTKGGGGLGTDFDLDGGILCADIAPKVYATFASKQGMENQHIDGGAGLFVTHTLRGEGFDASEDGCGRGTPLVPETAVTFVANNGGGGWSNNVDRAAAGMMVPEKVAVAICKDSFSGGAGGRPDGAVAGHFIPVQVTGEPTVLTERGRKGGSNLEYRQDGTANTILTPNGGRGGMGVGAIQHGWAVRRITPTECARLQGFPDDFCNVTFRNKPAADGPIYKALGNSWAVPCGRWIISRIADALTKMDEGVQS